METLNYLAAFGAGVSMVVLIMTIAYCAAVLFYDVKDR